MVSDVPILLFCGGSLEFMYKAGSHFLEAVQKIGTGITTGALSNVITLSCTHFMYTPPCIL